MFIKVFVSTILACLVSSAKSQSVRQLVDLMWVQTIDSADNILTPMGFEFKKSENITVDSVNYDVAIFSKMNTNITNDENILFYKDKTHPLGDFTFEVQFTTHSKEKFDRLRKECEADPTNKKGKENIENGVFSRYFYDEHYSFKFVIISPKNPGDINMYSVSITYAAVNVNYYHK